MLSKLTDAEIFEQFIHKNYIGAKRFSLEGGESMIAMLDLCIEYAGAQGVEEIVIGMAHRGRLNVMINILGKDPRETFAAFDDKHPDRFIGGGDVKYHHGYSTDVSTSSGQKVHLSLAFNPSHLEWVNRWWRAACAPSKTAASARAWCPSSSTVTRPSWARASSPRR